MSGPEVPQGSVSGFSIGEILQRLRRNIAVVVGSRLIFGLVNLATNILVIRAFGVAELGVAVMLQGYVRLFAGIVQLQSWQVILRFGAIAQEEAERSGSFQKLRQLFGFGFFVDIVTMGLAIVGAILCAPAAAELFDWPPEVALFAPFFMLSMPFVTHMTPNGIVRLYQRVDALAWQFAINAMLRLIGVSLAALFGGGMLEIVLAWFAASVISGLIPVAVAFREMNARANLPTFSGAVREARRMFPGVWRFLIFTNITGAGSQVLTNGTTLFVGAYFGAAETGIYETARRFSTALSRPTRLLGPLIFPDIAMLSAKSDWRAIRKLVLRLLRTTALLLLGAAAVLFPILPWLVELLFGSEFSDHIWLFRILLAGVLISVLGFAFGPWLLSANKSGVVLVISYIAIVFYVIIAGSLYQGYGTLAFAWGLLGYYALYEAMFISVGLILLARRHRKADSRSQETE